MAKTKTKTLLCIPMAMVLALALTGLAGCAKSTSTRELLSPQSGPFGADMHAAGDSDDGPSEATNSDGGAALGDGGEADDDDDDADAGVDDDDPTAALPTRRQS